MNQFNESNLVFIRADSSLQIGSGHIERCITLARELKKRGMKIHFICRSHIGNIGSRIIDEGFDVTMLPVNKNILRSSSTRYKSWLGVDWTQDANDTSKILLKKKPRVLILDHYAIDIKWQNSVKSSTNVKIMVIDGLANRRHNCEILLDYTYSLKHRKKWKNLISSKCKLLLGIKYILLKNEFMKIKKSQIKKKTNIKRILVAFGGYDKINATSVAIDAINLLGVEKIYTDVVIGKNNPNIIQIQKICNQKPNIKLHVQPKNIVKLLCKADLSIGGGGTMLWERCYLGIPSILISIAKNQLNQAAAVGSYGAVINLGIYKKNIKIKIIKYLKKLLNDRNLYYSISQKCFQIMKASRAESNYNPTKFVCDKILDI